MKLSDIRVAEWDGRYEPELLTNAPPDVDIVFLANRDKVMGQVNSLSDATLNVETRQGPLEIPVERITQVYFRADGTAPEFLIPQPVRMIFPGGEKLGLSLDRWAGGQVAGTSSLFGPVSFDSERIRQLTFQPQGTDGKSTAALENHPISGFE